MTTRIGYAPDPVPFFIYGTLRPGEKLHPWIADIQNDAVRGTVDGYSLYTQARGQSYPYLVPTEGEKVRGDLITLTDGKPLRRLISMELGAGYELGEVTVNTGLGLDRDGNSVQITAPALTFVWNGALRGLTPLGVDDWKRRPRVDSNTHFRRVR